MAAPTILQVMQGIETRLATIPGLRTSEFVAEQINPPQALVGVPPIPRYHATMQRGRFTLEPTVTIFTSAALDRVGQQLLAEYANPTGAKSIIAAVEGDKKLGGVVDDCFVTSFRPLGMVEVGVVFYLAGEFELQVIAQGS